MPQLFKIKANIPVPGSGEEFFRPNEVRTAEDLRGANIAWLVESKAIEPVGGTAGTLLVGANPTRAELRQEVERLQGIVEDVVAKRDSMLAELEDLREIRDRVPPPLRHSEAVPDDPSEVASLKAQVDSLTATVANLTQERDAARNRADGYAAQLTLAESAAKSAAIVVPNPDVHVNKPGSAPKGENQNPVPNPATPGKRK